MTAGMRGLVSRGLYEGKTLVARHPAIAMPIARIRGHGVCIDQRTDILIEGYPRSANVFTTTAFAMAQGRPMQIAHHVHAPAHVIAAVSAGIPSLVLVREPEDAVLRVVVYKQNVTIAQALRAYVRFYRPLLPWRHGFVIGHFPDVTTNLGTVIRRVNERFGTDFAEFAHTAENAQVCFDAMDEHWRARVDSAELLERYVNRPSDMRRRWVAALAPAYRAPNLSHLRHKADRLHAVLAEAGG
ncbi:MAG: hypothetical protein ACRD0R_07475 [Acidimicrobiales bacterium]